MLWPSVGLVSGSGLLQPSVKIQNTPQAILLITVITCMSPKTNVHRNVQGIVMLVFLFSVFYFPLPKHCSVPFMWLDFLTSSSHVLKYLIQLIHLLTEPQLCLFQSSFSSFMQAVLIPSGGKLKKNFSLNKQHLIKILNQRKKRAILNPISQSGTEVKLRF